MLNFRKNNNRMLPFGTNPYGMNNQPMMGNNYELEKLSTEIQEIRRQLSDMQKRINRIENFLGIRSDSSKESTYPSYDKMY